MRIDKLRPAFLISVVVAILAVVSLIPVALIGRVVVDTWYTNHKIQGKMDIAESEIRKEMANFNFKSFLVEDIIVSSSRGYFDGTDMETYGQVYLDGSGYSFTEAYHRIMAEIFNQPISNLDGLSIGSKTASTTVNYNGRVYVVVFNLNRSSNCTVDGKDAPCPTENNEEKITDINAQKPKQIYIITAVEFDRDTAEQSAAQD